MADLNLLLTLDALLDEGSVAGAARRLRLSPSAMSRALARLRAVTGDPLLVRAGRGLVATPRAIALREEVRALVEGAQAVLRPAEALDLSRLERRFTLRSSEGFAETFGPALLAETRRQAPGVTLYFLTKPDKDSTPLRAGEVDLETGVIDAETAPELRRLGLFQDHWLAVLRPDHPLLRSEAGPLTPALFAAEAHVVVARRGLQDAALEEALARAGLQRRVGALVSGFASAIALARQSDLIATVPARHSLGLRAGMAQLTLPVAVPAFALSLFWHPRMEGDPAHRWLRGLLPGLCAARLAEAGDPPPGPALR